MNDYISRQAVIDSLHNKFADGFDSDRWWNSMSVLYAINKVPSVNPQEPKTGHWIEHEIEDTLRWLECSNCHYETYNVKHNYCPNCGCRMVEPQTKICTYQETGCGSCEYQTSCPY